MSDSFKEVAQTHGIEVVQPGLETVPNQIYPQRVVPVPALADEPVPRDNRICGLRKMTFWLIVAVAALIAIVVALAVGLGVGLTRSHSTSTAPAAITSSGTTSAPSSSSPISSSLTSSSPTSSSSTSSSSTSSSSSTITSGPSPTSTTVFSKSAKYTCPDANNTEVTNVSQGSSYYIFCDADISSSSKKDLASSVQSSFADCLALCSSMNYFQGRTDVGCTYNFEGTGTQDKGTCWCLGGADKSFITNEGNMAAVLTTENVSLDL
ncbi:hypothetical protein BDV26DRAFT_255132 [Aspergillus bertholletiae]|uniref:Apple domain-containing protein n=1 Tax=Aspergillus bertholletiae TaxID=1226010 RepID=A0A5N7BIL6_9EURO|nr:hypothetical protein BDV26DRAFT_255132 [Aspergillus bertholletiae]